MKHAAAWVAGAAILLLSVVASPAQVTHRLDPSAIQNLRTTMVARQPNLKGLNATTSSGATATDSIVTFDGTFSARGYGPTGKSQHHWYYTVVGLPPNKNRTTTFRAPIVPVSIELLEPVGVLAYDNGHPLYSDATHYAQAVVNSPIFQKSLYSSSNGPTQFTDAVMRAEFHRGVKDGWHTLLTPVVTTPYVMKIPYGSYYYALNANGTCCAFVLIEESKFSELFLPSGVADASTAVGNAEALNEITTTDIATFLFPNTFLYSGNPRNCCILGFHTVDYQPGSATNSHVPRGYVVNYSSWISPGVFASGPQDISALSHEIAETFNDPFVASDGVHGITPWWKSPNGNCEDILEVGDAVEGLPNSTYTVTLNNYTYHPQNEALLQWFEFDRYSDAISHAYSYPNTSILKSLSAIQRPNCK